MRSSPRPTRRRQASRPEPPTRASGVMILAQDGGTFPARCQVADGDPPRRRGANAATRSAADSGIRNAADSPNASAAMPTAAGPMTNPTRGSHDTMAMPWAAGTPGSEAAALTIAGNWDDAPIPTPTNPMKASAG